MMADIFGGISLHRLLIWFPSCVSVATTVVGAITGETILLAMGTAGGVALGLMALRDKVRDYRAESLEKQVRSLDKQLDEERADHDQTRARLRQANLDLIRQPPA